MLKGKTRIELTDVKSGEVEVFEKTNLVTNALNLFLKRYSDSRGNFSASDIPYRILTGGLIIFDGNIPESADTIFPPDDVKLIGCARYDYKCTYATPEMGDFNPDESMVVYNTNEKYAKMVYDFPTSKCNGNIGCICLTHRDGSRTAWGLSIPKDPYYYQDYTYVEIDDVAAGFDRYETPFYLDEGNDWLYSFVPEQGRVKIRKRYGGIKDISIFTPKGKNCILEEREVEISFITETTGSAKFFDAKNKKLYLFSCECQYKDSYKYETKYTVAEIKIPECTLQLKTFGPRIVCDTNSYQLIIYDGYAYESTKTYDTSSREYTNSFYRYPVDNEAAKETIDTNYLFYPQYWVPFDGYLFQTTDITKNCMINTQTLDISYCSLKFPRDPTIICMSSSGLLFYERKSESSMKLYKRNDYLATINNQSGIIKTADKTMKIIYELRETEETTTV